MKEAKAVLDTYGDLPIEDPRPGQRGAVVKQGAKEIV